MLLLLIDGLDHISVNHKLTFFHLLTSQGTPQLQLNSGAGAFATYSSGSNTAILTFAYVVSIGEGTPRLDYSDFSSLHSGATLYRPSDVQLTAPLVVQLPLPSAPNSLAYDSFIEIDTTTPYIVSVTSPKPNGIYGAGESIRIVTTFSAPVMITSGVMLYLDVGSVNGHSACSYISGDGSDAVTWLYIVAQGDVSTDLATDSSSAGGIKGVIYRAATVATQVCNNCESFIVVLIVSVHS